MRPIARIVALAALAAGCARSVMPAGLDGGAPPDAPLQPDVPTPTLDVPALACDATPPLGTVRWLTRVAPDRFLVGPVAADADGNTWFLHDASLLGGTDPAPFVLSLDRCGAVRWRAPWPRPATRYPVPRALLAGARLLVASVDLRAFDAASGAMQWVLDLPALASREGLGDASQGGAVRGLVADAAGNAYVLLQTRGTVAIVRADPAGTPSVLARLADVPDDSTATDLALDAQGQLEVPITETNVNPGPGVIHAFALDGTPRWVARLGLVDYQDHLTMGSDFLVSGDTGTIVALDGTVRGETGVVFAGPGATDAADDLYVFDGAPGGGGGHLASFDRAGARRWRVALPGTYAYEYDLGPLLGQRTGFYVFEGSAPASDGGVSSTQDLFAFDLATGALTHFSYPGAGWGYALLTTAGLVFTLDGAAVAVSSGGETPDATGPWTTPRGGIDRRGAVRGR